MQAFFLSGSPGQRFCIFHPSSHGVSRGAVIYLHPFAEEMNKSRRMGALQARAMAVAGYDVLQIDLYGCGDSSGDFSDATWQSWLEDVRLAHRWIRSRNDAPLILWGLRAGCLLATDPMLNLPERADFIFWHPVVSGRQYWQQFMRLKMAAGLAAGQVKGVTDSLKQQLAKGEVVEIAGYSVSPSLVGDLEKAELNPSLSHSGRVLWLETSMREETSIGPASQKYIERWQAAGSRIEAKMVSGVAFWQTTEIRDAPELIAATSRFLEFRV